MRAGIYSKEGAQNLNNGECESISWAEENSLV